MQGNNLTTRAVVRQEIFAPLARSATEMATVVYIDAASLLLGARHFLSRNVSCVEVSIRAIVIDALALDAHAVVLAHNHPSGDVEPSEADLCFTRRLFGALETVGVRLHDHLIVSPGRQLSFRGACLL